jgi:hypothetical protein
MMRFVALHLRGTKLFETTLVNQVPTRCTTRARDWRIERIEEGGDEQVNEFSLIVLHVCDVKVLM